jgi:CTP:molybdopterin cytidylyltransferase MocA
LLSSSKANIGIGVMTTGAIILAAGTSSRMKQPKALLPWRSSTIIQELVLVFSRCHLSVVVVVSPSETGKNITHLLQNSAACVVNPEPARGMLSSLQIGAASLLSRGISSALITPVDQPETSEEICLKLLQEVNAGRWAIASYQGQWGHPYTCPDLKEIVTLSENETASKLLQRKGPVLLECGPSVLYNLNTYEEYLFAQKKEPSYG